MALKMNLSCMQKCLIQTSSKTLKSKILKQLHWDYLMKIKIIYKSNNAKAKSYTQKTSYT